MAKRENYMTPARTPVPYPEELLLQADEHALEIGPEILGMRSGAVRRLVELALTLERDSEKKGYTSTPAPLIVPGAGR